MRKREKFIFSEISDVAVVYYENGKLFLILPTRADRADRRRTRVKNAKKSKFSGFLKRCQFSLKPTRWWVTGNKKLKKINKFPVKCNLLTRFYRCCWTKNDVSHFVWKLFDSHKMCVFWQFRNKTPQSSSTVEDNRKWKDWSVVDAVVDSHRISRRRWMTIYSAKESTEVR